MTAVRVDGVKPLRQQEPYTCGPAALRTIFGFYGIKIPEHELVEDASIDEDGTSEYQMRRLAHQYGFSFYGRANGHIAEITQWLARGIPILICYQDWGPANGRNGHYAVLTGIDDTWVELADPANHYHSPQAYSKRMHREKFLKRWFEIEEGERVRKWFAICKPRKLKGV